MKISVLFNVRTVGWRLLVAFTLLPFSSSCASSSSDSQPPAGQIPGNSSWRLVALHGQPLTAATGENAPTLLFDSAAKRVSGLAGINRFSGSYTLSGSNLSFGPLVTTRMAGPPEAMKLESEYLKALASVATWSVIEGQLVVLNTGKEPLLSFEKP